MENVNEKFLKYWYSVFYDSLIFDKNGIININSYQEDLVKDEYLNGLNDKIQQIITTKCYPKFAIERIGNIIEFIKGNADNKLIFEIEEKYNGIKNTTLNYEYMYYDEAMKKFLDINLVKSFNDFKLDFGVIEKSVVYDYVTFYDLCHENLDVQESPFYVASLKKFFIDLPEMFLAENIHNRAIQMLEKNQNNPDTQNLLYNIQNNYVDGFRFADIKGLYDTVLIQNMLYDRDLIREKAHLLDSNQIGTVYYFISQSAIGDSTIKDNLYYILSEYRSGVLEKISSDNRKELFERHNKYIEILNSFDDYNYDMLENDLIQRFSSIRELKRAKNLDFKKLFKTDLDILNYIIYGEQMDSSADIHLSINKFLYLTPYIFDNQQIYNRTLELLNDKNKNDKKIKKIIVEEFGR